MSLKQEIEKLKFDKRLMDWYLSQGKLKQQELDQYLSSLPDSAQNVEELELTDEPAGEASLRLVSSGNTEQM